MPSQSISRQNAEHYLWGGQCDGWHLVKHPALSVIEEQMPPGTAETRHSHKSAQQFFYVLAGEITMEVAGESLLLRTGEGIHIPAETAHRVQNISDRPVRFLVISQPPSHGDRVIADLPAD